MTPRVQALLRLLKSGEYTQYRTRQPYDAGEDVKDLSGMRRIAALHKLSLENERPLIFENDRIGFNRTSPKVAFVRRADGSMPDENGPGNVTPDYEAALSRGMDDIRAELSARLEDAGEAQREFYEAALTSVDASLQKAREYRDHAKETGHDALYRALCRVPFSPPESFYEACVFLKFLIYTLRLNKNAHITLGRFDQYMYPYFAADKEKGVPDESLFETVEEFFISLNFDGDIYFGMQLGDNGQSMVLGGLAPDGKDGFNALSRMCMEASLELCMIDPKINLRVHKDTAPALYLRGSRLTAKGLGFPQYSNDDVVIPGLIALGYEPADAYNYTVAACWEFIIPGCGFDIPNIRTLAFPAVIARATDKYLSDSPTFEDFFAHVETELFAECGALMNSANGYRSGASPYLSVFITPCVRRGLELSQGGAKYNNFGCHGAGLAVAADSLTAIREAVYEKKLCTKEELLSALHTDFENAQALRELLLSMPKVGNNLDAPDEMMDRLMELFVKYMSGRPNGVGGVWRCGTGSAQDYYYRAKDVPATADGRKRGDMYGCSFSPALTARVEGPLSCIMSFTKFDLTRIINGGPLTMELHDSVFRNEEGIEKTAALVRSFILRGGHQLQLNAVNRDRLLEAQKDPDAHRDLIVRVWGWSGRFVELEAPFQEHIIRRTEFAV